MSSADRAVDRTKGFGESYELSIVDRAGMWLSKRQIVRHVRGFAGKRVADIGCGHEAVFMRPLLGEVEKATLVNVSLADDLKADSRITALEGMLPEVLERIPDASFDLIICNNVLEHLWEPRSTVEHMRRALAPGGAAFINVPSWRGKFILEAAAFRFGWTSAAEIDDHKRYYDPANLWALLVDSGFKPKFIDCHLHKLGMNVYAVCRVAGG